MPQYVVRTKEVWAIKYIVEATDQDEAVRKVDNLDDCQVLDSSFEYIEKLDAASWDVEEDK